MMGPAAYASVTGDGLVRAGSGQLVSVLLAADGAIATIVLYDNTAASGTIIAKLKTADGSTVQFSPSVPIACNLGIYADITGTGATAIVAYL